MLSRAHRLRGDAAFKRFAKAGRPFFSQNITLRIAPHAETVKTPSRFAFVVSTKVSKSAVKRNAIRRKLREIVRLTLPRLKSGLDVLVITKPQICGRSYQELDREMQDLFEKSRLFI